MKAKYLFNVTVTLELDNHERAVLITMLRGILANPNRADNCEMCEDFIRALTIPPDLISSQN